MQGYYDAGYEPAFVPADSAMARLNFICANLRLPKPSRGAGVVVQRETSREFSIDTTVR